MRDNQCQLTAGHPLNSPGAPNPPPQICLFPRIWKTGEGRNRFAFTARGYLGPILPGQAFRSTPARVCWSASIASRPWQWEGGQFKPKALLFTVNGAPSTLKSVTLQKENGTYSLLIWNELVNWDSLARHSIENPPAAITLKFQTPVEETAHVLRQKESGAFASAEHLKITSGKLSLAVPSSVNSAPPYVSKTWTGNSGHDDWAPVPGSFSVVYTIHYHAASRGRP
jgi:hypothetical protein